MSSTCCNERSRTYTVRQAVVHLKVLTQQLRSRKPMAHLQAEIETKNELRRTLSCVQLTAIGLGGTIGAGIFLLSGQAAAKFAGPSVIVSFILAGFVALLSSLSFSEMSSLMSSSGSAYTYTYAALGEYLAWFIGWNSALLYQLAAMTVVVSWSKHVTHLLSLTSSYNGSSSFLEAPVVWAEATNSFRVTGQFINFPSIAITMGITVLLVVGLRPMAMVNLVFVVIKIIVLLIFIIACAKDIDRSNYTPFFPPNQDTFSRFGVTGMLQACTYVFFAFVGFDTISTVAQEVKEPCRSVPRATIITILISLLIYIGICTVMIGLVPYNLLNLDNPLAEAVKRTSYGLWLLILMDLGALFSLATVALIVLLSQTRVFYAMAHDGLLPAIFARIHSNTKTPWLSTIVSGVFCAVIAGFCPVDLLGETTSIAALVTYIFVHVDVIVMRYTHCDIPRPFRVPFGPWVIPVVGILTCLLLLKGISRETVFRFLAWSVIGQVIYFCYGYRHSKGRRPPRTSATSLHELSGVSNSTAADITADESSVRGADEPSNTPPGVILMNRTTNSEVFV